MQHHTSPFSRFPREIKDRIFLSACKGTLSDHESKQHQLVLRRTLQLVSKDWQQSVINNPMLWNVLDLRIAPPGHGHGPVSLAVVDASLRRARSWLCHAARAPISLDLSIHSCIAEEEAELRGRIFSFLSAYKFKALSIVTRIPSIFDLNEYAESLFNVEALSLSASAPFHPQIRLISNRLPFSSLKSLGLDVNIGNTYEDLLSVFPWDRLHRLLLSVTRNTETVADVLRQCTSLHDCTIIIKQGPTTFITLEDINFPCLKHLTIDNEVINPVTQALVQSIVAPELESLVLYCKYPGSIPISDAVETMARKSGFQDGLRELVIRNIRGVMTRPGKTLLKFMPSLRVLKVSGRAVISKDILPLLGNGSLVPHLEKVSFSGCGIRPDALLEMTENRQKNAKKEGSRNMDMVAPFSHVSLRCRHSRVTDDHLERMLQLRKEYNFYMALSGGSSDSLGSNGIEDDSDEADVVSEDESSGDELE